MAECLPSMEKALDFIPRAHKLEHRRIRSSRTYSYIEKTTQGQSDIEEIEERGGGKKEGER